MSMLKKVLRWGGIALLVFYVVRNPHGAALTARSIGSAIGNVGTGFGNFLGSLATGG
jgi:hypothetical protein